MALDQDETISKLQSTTVKAALAAIIINALALVTVFTGYTFDIDLVKQVIDLGLPIGINTATIWLAWKAYKGRVNATKTIRKE